MAGAGFKTFTIGEVLTASDVNTYLMQQAVMTFADSGARGSAIGTATEGMLSYLADTNTLEVYDGSAWTEVGASKMKKVASFTASGTWTVPSGVTYAIAHMQGGGGGSGTTTSGSDGGDSSVAFAGGTVTANGLSKAIMQTSSGVRTAQAGRANTGQSGQMIVDDNAARGNSAAGGVAPYVTAGDSVSPGASITVTVGAGGAAGTGGAAGGSGYVWIEYYE